MVRKAQVKTSSFYNLQEKHYPPDRFSVSHSLLSKFTHPSTPAQSLADCRGVPSTELSWQSGLAPGVTKGDRFSKSLFIEALEGRPHSLSREKSAPHPFFRCSTFARSHRFILTTRSSRRTNSRLLRCSSSFSLELSTFQIAVEDRFVLSLVVVAGPFFAVSVIVERELRNFEESLVYLSLVTFW